MNHRPTGNQDIDPAPMRRAIELAQTAASLGETPVGAVIVRHGQIIAEAYNQRELLNDPTAHAERLALTQAGAVTGSWRLDDCLLYVTLEPCAMCAGAIVLSRIPLVVYGARDPKAGACQSLYRLASDPRLNHRATLVSGILEQECRQLLTDFFETRREIRRADQENPRRGA